MTSSLIHYAQFQWLLAVIVIVSTETVECRLRLETKNLTFFVDSKRKRGQSRSNEVSTVQSSTHNKLHTKQRSWHDHCI